MGRFIAVVLLAAGIGGGVAWHLGKFDSFPIIGTRGGQPPIVDNGNPELTPTIDPALLGSDLYVRVPLEKPLANQERHGADPVIVAGVLGAIEKMDVCTRVPGEILFVGQEIPEGVCQVTGTALLLQGKVQTALVELGDSKHYKLFCRLSEGDVVEEGAKIASIDPAKAIHGIHEKSTKVFAAEAEATASGKIFVEAERRLELDLRLWQQKTLSETDLSNSKLTATKQYAEWVAKKEGTKLANIDLTQAKLILGYHYASNKLPVKASIVKTIYKRTGEAVKELEPIMHLYAVDRLNAEGLVELQFASRLTLGKKVSVEPTRETSPLRVWRSHKKEVTAVAVTHSGLAASASEDGTVCLWDERYSGPVALFAHSQPVQTLACSPAGPEGTKIHWLLAGLADGSIAVWDLDNVKPEANAEPKMILKSQHGGAVTALAFSPNGRFFASGSTDGAIVMWDTQSNAPTGDYRAYPFDAEHGVGSRHSGQITALHFTPQCTLVSAARDNTLRIWDLKEKGAMLKSVPIAGRSGNVGSLGVSRDGSTILFDQGKTLQFLTPDGRAAATLQNPAGTIPFETLAEFSPDASLLLTAGASEGRMQLWKAPTDGKRGFELRQFVTSERSGVTSAAFFDANAKGEIPYAISGAKDGVVYLWGLPTRGDIKNHRIENVTLNQISQNVETRQIRIGVEVPNENRQIEGQADDRLIPGQPVTIVIE